MSYTKLNKEIDKYYKTHKILKTHNGETKEQQEERIKRYKKISDIIVEEWKRDKRYKELISVCHGGWFEDEELEKPLREHFVRKNELSYLKFLCERGLRYRIEDTLNCLKYVKQDYPNITNEEIFSFDLKAYMSSKDYHSIGELLKWQKEALALLDEYIKLLKQIRTKDEEYFKYIKTLREKVEDLSVKKTELKAIKFKLKKEEIR